MTTGAGEWTRFSAALTRMSAELRQSDAAGALGAALHVKRSIEVRAAAVGAGRLGEVAIRQRAGSASALVRATDGRAHMVERGTKPHEIKPDEAGRRRQIGQALRALFGQQRGRRRVRAKLRMQALHWQGARHPHTKPIQHPGSSARPFFWPGVEDALPTAAASYAAAIDRHAIRAFR